MVQKKIQVHGTLTPGQPTSAQPLDKQKSYTMHRDHVLKQLMLRPGKHSQRHLGMPTRKQSKRRPKPYSGFDQQDSSVPSTTKSRLIHLASAKSNPYVAQEK